MLRRTLNVFVLMVLSASILAHTPASALDCPLLKDRSAKNWAVYFKRGSPIIFRGKVVSLDFIGMEDDGFPAYSVRYQVLENIQGSMPPTFTASWMPWCGACTIESAKQDVREMIGKEYLVRGSLLLEGISWSFEPQICWGFIDLPFHWSDGDLLISLRSSTHGSNAPQ